MRTIIIIIREQPGLSAILIPVIGFLCFVCVIGPLDNWSYNKAQRELNEVVPTKQAEFESRFQSGDIPFTFQTTIDICDSNPTCLTIKATNKWKFDSTVQDVKYMNGVSLGYCDYVDTSQWYHIVRPDQTITIICGGYSLDAAGGTKDSANICLEVAFSVVKSGQGSVVKTVCSN